MEVKKNILDEFCDIPQIVNYTLFRAYNKNDNADIEEKNWTDWTFKQSYSSGELYYSLNFFIPSPKLVSKQRYAQRLW